MSCIKTVDNKLISDKVQLLFFVLDSKNKSVYLIDLYIDFSKLISLSKTK